MILGNTEITTDNLSQGRRVRREQYAYDKELKGRNKQGLLIRAAQPSRLAPGLEILPGVLTR